MPCSFSFSVNLVFPYITHQTLKLLCDNIIKNKVPNLHLFKQILIFRKNGIKKIIDNLVVSQRCITTTILLFIKHMSLSTPISFEEVKIISKVNWIFQVSVESLKLFTGSSTYGRISFMYTISINSYLHYYCFQTWNNFHQKLILFL